jgi:hypothetical protein
MDEAKRSQRLAIARVAAYPLLYALSATFALLLWTRNPPWIGWSYGRSLQFPELLGFFATMVAIAIALIEVAGSGMRHHRVPASMPVVGFVVVALFYTGFIVEFCGQPYFDYRAYEGAAQAIIAGDNPYGIVRGSTSYNYLYPPLFAQGLAALGRVAVLANTALSLRLPVASLWRGVFFVYGTLQCGLVWLLYVQCYQFLRALRLAAPTAAAVSAVVLIVNVPLARTLLHGQANLWVLCPLMTSALLAPGRPLVAGSLAGFGAHIKLYPLVLFPQWIMLRRFSAAAGLLVGAGAIAAAQVVLGDGLRLWSLFLDFARRWPPETAVRNNSIACIAHNSGMLAARALGVDRQFLVEDAIRYASLTGYALAIAFLMWRFIVRERSPWHRPVDAYEINLRWFGHFADACSAMLLVSPSIWEHHFVLGIPTILYAIATIGVRRPWAVGLGTGLILAIPTFDVYPFSYHRIAGLLMLMILTDPRRIPARPLVPEVSAGAFGCLAPDPAGHPGRPGDLPGDDTGDTQEER